MDEGRRDSLIARLALLLVFILVGALLWPWYGERITAWGAPLIDGITAQWARFAERPAPAPPPRAQAPSPRSGMPPLPEYPPPLILDSPAAPAQASAPPLASTSAPSVAKDQPAGDVAAAPKGAPNLSEPVPAVQTPEEKERAAANARMVPPGSDGATPAVPVDALMLDRLMDRGIAMFNATVKEAERVEAARLIYVTAVLGYGPARAVIARSYPRSQAARAVTPATDAVRFALDIFAIGGTYSKNPEHVVTSLAVYLLDQGQGEALANAVVDAMRDDRRLQMIEPLDLMFDSLDLARGACPAIGRLVKAPPAVAGSECYPSLKSQALSYARQAGPTGRDAAMRPQIDAAYAEILAKYR
jgi:hypothetical protein